MQTVILDNKLIQVTSDPTKPSVTLTLLPGTPQENVTSIDPHPDALTLDFIRQTLGV